MELTGEIDAAAYTGDTVQSITVADIKTKYIKYGKQKLLHLQDTSKIRRHVEIMKNNFIHKSHRNSN